MMRRLAGRHGPELVVVVLLVVAFVASAAWERRFLDVAYLFDRTTLSTEVGLMALAMTFVIVAGHIDLSCTAILALVAAVSTTLFHKAGVPLPVLAVLAPVMGGLLGWLNGVLVARAKLPSLVVTLATMALFRGIAQILLGDHSLSIPANFQGIERLTIPRTYFHVPLLMYLGAAVVAGLVLHRTVFGRWTTAIWVNPEAARHAGIPVGPVLERLFILSGVVAGIASVTMVSRLGVARFDHARGFELDVITAVVLGGTSIHGGRGTIFGSVVALALIGVVQTGMGVAGVKTEFQIAAIGALLLGAVLLSNLTARRR
ncbi:MAG: ABC transporter permease [Armatimonadota bacterium]